MDLDSPAATVPSGRALDRRILALALPVLATLAADPLYHAHRHRHPRTPRHRRAGGRRDIANVVLELSYTGSSSS